MRPPPPPLPEYPDDVPDIRNLSHEELKKIDHNCGKWVCCAEGCTKSSTVWDFGILPVFYFPNRKSWIGLAHVLYCGRHWRQITKQMGREKFVMKTATQLQEEREAIFKKIS